MIKKIIFSVFSLCTGLTTFSQVNYNVVIPPSPQTAEFEKYINYSVSMYTGVPDISIPLYTIHLKGMDVPISLSYHASGIKYHQTNGEVGVGWVLNPGYRVSRTVYGEPDDRDGFDMPAGIDDSLNAYSDPFARDKFLARFASYGSNSVPKPYPSAWYADGQRDLFNYMLPTDNGSFIIMDRANNVVQSLEESNTRIHYTRGTSSHLWANGISNFDLTDDKGNNYAFGEHVSTDNNVFEYAPTITYATAWGLTGITTSLGDQLKFSYLPKTVNGWNTEYRTETIQEGSLCTSEQIQYQPPESSGDQGYLTFSIDQINNDREKITFERNLQGFISQIKVYNSANTLVRGISFYYTHNDNQFHTFLDSVQIRDRNNIAIQTYRFAYNFRDYPYSNDFGIDQWGYYMEGGPPSNLHQEFSNYSIYAGPSTDPVVTWINGFADRTDVGREAPIWYSLSSITYPTGGRTDYEYELNKYQWNGTVVPGGGMRVKSITSYDLDNSKTLERSYIYGDNDCGIAKMHVDQTYFEDETIHGYISGPAGTSLTASKVSAFSTSMMGDIGTTGFTSNVVSYPKVTEVQTSDQGNNGKTVYIYALGTEYEVGPLQRGGGNCAPPFVYDGPKYVTGYNYCNRPLLQETDYYSANNDLIRKDSMVYSTNVSQLVGGVKVSVGATVDGYTDVDYYQYMDVTGSFYRYNLYMISYGKNLLINKKEITYHGNQSITESVDYVYNGEKQLSEEIHYLRNGKKHYTFYNYPYDYAAGTIFIDSMVGRNIIEPPVEKVEAEEKAGNVYILGGTLTRFKSTNAALPESISLINNAAPIPLSGYKFSNQAIGTLPLSGTHGIFSPDNSFESRITFDNYDAKSNLIQQTKVNDLSKAYIWDYQCDLPICETINATSGSIAYTSFEADGTGNWIIGSPLRLAGGVTGSQYYELGNGNIVKSGLDPTATYILSYWKQSAQPLSISGTVSGYPKVGKTIIHNGNPWTYYEYKITGQSSITLSGSGQFDELRLYPGNAQMKTYTFEPLFGMTSECDAKSQIVYYEYDGSGRLMDVKDQDGNIIKTFDYHYKGQQ